MVSASDRSIRVMGLARRRIRRAERGAAVFIVVMAIVLLTGIGIFAVRTASMVDVAAGYDRQATQSYHLSELAARTAASHASGLKETLRMLLLNNPNAQFPLDQAVLAERVNRDSSNQLFLAPTADEDGSLSSRQPAALNGFSIAPDGQILVFLSDANDHELTPGEEVGKDPPLEVSITALGQIRPSGAVTNNIRPWCSAPNSSQAATVQTLRSHITIVK